LALPINPLNPKKLLLSKLAAVKPLARQAVCDHRSIAVSQRDIDVNDDMKRNAVELI